MNVFTGIGNINKPELRYLADTNKTPVLQFSFAANSGYGDKKITTWINCSLFGKRAETLADMVNKGDRVGVTGELTNRPYTTKEGVERYSLELRVNDLTLLGSKSDAVHEPRTSSKAEQGGFDDVLDDAPF
jgi:single-strand DNA-binding protein